MNVFDNPLYASFACDGCGKTFVHKASVRRHQRSCKHSVNQKTFDEMSRK